MRKTDLWKMWGSESCSDPEHGRTTSAQEAYEPLRNGTWMCHALLCVYQYGYYHHEEDLQMLCRSPVDVIVRISRMLAVIPWHIRKMAATHVKNP